MIKIQPLLACLLLSLLPIAGDGQAAAIPVFSGRKVTMPYEGKWVLTVPPGRVLVNGYGPVAWELAAMTPGSSVSAELAVNDRKVADLRIWSPRLLMIPDELKELSPYVIAAGGEKVNVRRELDLSGLERPLTLVFSEFKDFPAPVAGSWQSVLLKKEALGGKLGINSGKDGQLLTLDGENTYVELKKTGFTVIVFAPGFDFDRIESILLLKRIIEEHQK